MKILTTSQLKIYENSTSVTIADRRYSHINLRGGGNGLCCGETI